MISSINLTKIVVADDHPVVLHGLVNLIKSEPDFELAAVCSDGAAALGAIHKLNPDVALLDLKLPKLTGLEVLERLAIHKLKTRVIILTAFAEDSDVLTAVSRGVNGILLKESAADALIQCLRRVAAGVRWISPSLVGRALERRVEAELIIKTLTAREREVMRRVGEGLPSKQLAHQLGLSEGTLKLHLHNIYSKTGVNNRLALAQLVRRLGEDLE